MDNLVDKILKAVEGPYNKSEKLAAMKLAEDRINASFSIEEVVAAGGTKPIQLWVKTPYGTFLLGVMEGISLKDAANRFAKKSMAFRHSYNADDLTYDGNPIVAEQN